MERIAALTYQIKVSLCPHPSFYADQAGMWGQLSEQGRLPQQAGGYQGVMWVQRRMLAGDLLC